MPNKNDEVKKIREILRNIHIETNELDDFLKLGHIVVLEVKNKDIEEEIEKAFKILKSYFPEHLRNSLLYLLGELTDNINQHSNYSRGYLLLHYDNKNRIVNMVILDDGMTIPRSFEKNNIKIKDDSNAIMMAMEGKSTKKEIGRGYGLSSSRKLIEEGLKGFFMIISRKGFYQTGDSKSKMSGKLNGTLVYVRFEDSGESLNIYKYVE